MFMNTGRLWQIEIYYNTWQILTTIRCFFVLFFVLKFETRAGAPIGALKYNFIYYVKLTSFSNQLIIRTELWFKFFYQFCLYI